MVKWAFLVKSYAVSLDPYHCPYGLRIRVDLRGALAFPTMALCVVCGTFDRGTHCHGSLRERFCRRPQGMRLLRGTLFDDAKHPWALSRQRRPDVQRHGSFQRLRWVRRYGFRSIERRPFILDAAKSPRDVPPLRFLQAKNFDDNHDDDAFRQCRLPTPYG